MFVKHFNFVSLWWWLALVMDWAAGDQNDPGLVTEAAIITVTMGHLGPGHHCHIGGHTTMSLL